jgi:hypothetical protein
MLGPPLYKNKRTQKKNTSYLSSLQIASKRLSFPVLIHCVHEVLGEQTLKTVVCIYSTCLAAWVKAMKSWRVSVWLRLVDSLLLGDFVDREGLIYTGVFQNR